MFGGRIIKFEVGDKVVITEQLLKCRFKGRPMTEFPQYRELIGKVFTITDVDIDWLGNYYTVDIKSIRDYKEKTFPESVLKSYNETLIPRLMVFIWRLLDDEKEN